MKLSALFENENVEKLEKQVADAKKRLKAAQEADRGPGQSRTTRQELKRAEQDLQSLESKLSRARDPRDDQQIADDRLKELSKRDLQFLKKIRSRADERMKKLPAYGAGVIKSALPKIDKAIEYLEAGGSRVDVDFNELQPAIRLLRDT